MGRWRSRARSSAKELGSGCGMTVIFVRAMRADFVVRARGMRREKENKVRRGQSGSKLEAGSGRG